MRAHLAKHKKKYGFVAAVGVAGFSFNTLIQTPPEQKGAAKPTVSQRQEEASRRLELGRQNCEAWIPKEQRSEIFGAAFDVVSGQFFSATGTESLSCTFREGSMSYLASKRTVDNNEYASTLFEAAIYPSSTAESVDVGEKGFWSKTQKQLIVRRGNDIYTLRSSVTTSSEAIVSIGSKLFGASE